MIFTPTISDSWKNACESITENGSLSSILLCGPRNTGKSTLGRFLANRFIERKTSFQIAWLETDIGQSEFLPPGFVSLVLVDSPIIDRPHTRILTIPPLASVYVGATTPFLSPSFYITAIKHVFSIFKNKFHDCDHPPLIVNTCGWMKGLGLELLTEIADIVQPKYLINLTENDNFDLMKISDNERDKDSIFCKYSKNLLYLPCYKQPDNSNSSNSNSKIPSSFLRTASFISYFGGINATPYSICNILRFKKPYVVSWDDITLVFLHQNIYDVNDFYFSSSSNTNTNIKPSFNYENSNILSALNGSFIGLSSISITSDDVNVKRSYDLDLRILVDYHSYFESGFTNSNSTLGLGIIRSIDYSKKLYYILTPLPLDLIQRCNVFFIGNIEIPRCFFVSEGECSQFSDLPYVSSNLSLVGNSAIKCRRNIQRKRLRT